VAKYGIKTVALNVLSALLLIVCADPLFGLLLHHVDPVPPDILSGQATQGIVKLWQLSDQHISPLVFTGSSEIKAAVIPAQFDAQIKTLTGVSVTSVNLGVLGANVKVSQDVIQNLLLPEGVHTIIYGIEMRALRSDSDVNSMWQGIFENSPLGYALSRPMSMENSALLWLLQHSTLDAYRVNIQHWLSGDFSVLSDVPQVDENGYWDLEGINNRNLDVIKQQFAPFQTNDDLEISLNGILATCQRPDIRCILVNMPLHNAAYQVISDQDEARYRAIVYQAAKQAKVAIWDFDTPTCQTYFTDDDYFELDHLNHDGARKFTEALANLYVQQIVGKQVTSSVCADVM
jgi:hypothetical protein